MQWLRSLIARAPKRATAVGKALFLAGGVLVLAALFGRIGLVSLNGERTQAGLSAVRTLADAYPQYPTWFVPEGPLGFAVAALLVLAGMGVIALAEKAR